MEGIIIRLRQTTTNGKLERGNIVLKKKYKAAVKE